MSPKKAKANDRANSIGKSPVTLSTKIEALKDRSNRRNGLGVYIDTPEANPDGRVIDYDDDFVVVKDAFPKASVHLLLLPRNPSYYAQHPLDALSDPIFLASVHPYIDRLMRLAAAELRRMYGHGSASDRPHHAALESLMSAPDLEQTKSQPTDSIPTGRNWLSEIVAGVHTHPSMNHMHIHVFSREMSSEWMKHKKHYLSFHTSFLVQITEFPLKKGSHRFHSDDWPSWDLKCWRCGRNFKNKFTAFKEHLNTEIEEWKVE